jgi:hypothetical protein
MSLSEHGRDGRSDSTDWNPSYGEVVLELIDEALETIEAQSAPRDGDAPTGVDSLGEVRTSLQATREAIEDMQRRYAAAPAELPRFEPVDRAPLEHRPAEDRITSCFTRVLAVCWSEAISPPSAFAPETLLAQAGAIGAAENPVGKAVGLLAEGAAHTIQLPWPVPKLIGMGAEAAVHLLVQDDFSNPVDRVFAAANCGLLYAESALDAEAGQLGESAAIKALTERYGLMPVDQFLQGTADRFAPLVNTGPGQPIEQEVPRPRPPGAAAAPRTWEPVEGADRIPADGAFDIAFARLLATPKGAMTLAETLLAEPGRTPHSSPHRNTTNQDLPQPRPGG